jgi:hypothetical protein
MLFSSPRVIASLGMVVSDGIQLGESILIISPQL